MLKKVIALLLVLCSLTLSVSALAAKSTIPDFSGFISHVPSGLNMKVFQKEYYSCSFFDYRYQAFIESGKIGKCGAFLRVWMGPADGGQLWRAEIAAGRGVSRLYLKHGENRYVFICTEQTLNGSRFMILGKPAFSVLEELANASGDVYIVPYNKANTTGLNSGMLLSADHKAVIRQYCKDVRSSGLYDRLPETDNCRVLTHFGTSSSAVPGYNPDEEFQ